MNSSFHHSLENPSKANFHEKSPPAIDESLLLEVVPKTALHLASFLSDEEKEVLVFLIVFEDDAVPISKPSGSTGNTPRRPWKLSSSKGGAHKDGCRSSSLLDVFTASFLSLEEGPSTKISSTPSVRKGGFVCDCFSLYSRAWSRWNASPNRDVINDILDIIENAPQYLPQAGKGKKKKRKKLEKKRVMEKDGEKEQIPMCKAILSKGSIPAPTIDEGCGAVGDDDLHISIAIDEVPEKSTVGRKKSLFRGLKQKSKACHKNSASFLSSERTKNELSLLGGTLDLLETAGGVVAIEIPENLTTETLTTGVTSSSLTTSQAKINGKQRQYARTGKRRSNQILPLDCEHVFDNSREQEPILVEQETHRPMSPRPPDAGLWGRGLLARVFPDALGRVASRLWDFVSVRMHIRTVEYH